MIVFKDFRKEISIKNYFEIINSAIKDICAVKNCKYSSFVDLLLEVSEFETGITDVECKGVDKITPSITLSHEITQCSAEMIVDIWKYGQTDTQKLTQIISKLYEVMKNFNDSCKIPECIAEGFSFYGLYPEQYIEAANIFGSENPYREVICIGLRSIGTSLSAIVAATLKKSGCRVISFTVRPKGHPFKRYVEVSDELRNIISQKKECKFAIVDEGPGLSGSSICGALELLDECGVNTKDVTIFPSWEPDASKFINSNARLLWPKYRKITVSFDDIWIESGKLEQSFRKKIINDFSAGKWRAYIYRNSSAYPYVHPHHERRKFLLEDENNRRYLAKWIGLGKYGNSLANRAHLFSNKSIAPDIFDYVNGFVIFEYINGQPMVINNVNELFLKFSLEYFTFVKKNLPGDITALYDKMLEMIIVNCIEELGKDFERSINQVCKFPKKMYEDDIVAVDGRMAAHEWIEGVDGYRKVDHLEHNCDQFFPGNQNIAWDIAAFMLEFDLTKKQKDNFLDLYIKKNGDMYIRSRIPFYSVAYLAYKLGYVSIAADSLMGTEDGQRFLLRKEFYRKRLLDEIKNQDSN